MISTHETELYMAKNKSFFLKFNFCRIKTNISEIIIELEKMQMAAIFHKKNISGFDSAMIIYSRNCIDFSFCFI